MGDRIILQKAWAVIDTDDNKILHWVDKDNNEQYDLFLSKQGAYNASKEWKGTGFNCEIREVTILGE